ncbi:MAG TPA: Gfo/Idh/MocA family oxidoreductase [Tepidisphaeraceae bacterium]|jgi:predicted dehydrogenase
MALGYALVGCGSFGNFCLQQYRTLGAVQLIGVYDESPALAKKTADAFGLRQYGSYDDVLADPAVDLIHLATPPFTHAVLAIPALTAGKHLLCEKPLAVDGDDATRMLAAARTADRVLAVNLVMRYDPINRVVKQILDEKILGEPIAGSMLNLARDNQLAPGHWFWDTQKSGGIFIEHVVHFFDLFEMWLGPAEVLSAYNGRRPGNDKIIEQVRCLTRHTPSPGHTVLIEQYHGFHQSEKMDRQELRLVCERGDLLLRGWLSESIEIDALLDANGVARLKALLGDYGVSLSSQGFGDETIEARHKSWAAEGRYKIAAKLPYPKPQLYGNVIRDLLADQAAYVADRSHVRAITELNGLRSLETARQAYNKAEANEATA